MSHLRKPCDFEFDFNSSSRIDCNEALSALPATINFIERHFYFFDYHDSGSPARLSLKNMTTNTTRSSAFCARPCLKITESPVWFWSAEIVI